MLEASAMWVLLVALYVEAGRRNYQVLYLMRLMGGSGRDLEFEYHDIPKDDPVIVRWTFVLFWPFFNVLGVLNGMFRWGRST